MDDLVRRQEQYSARDLDYCAPLGKSDHVLLSFKVVFKGYNIDEPALTLNYNKDSYTSIGQALDELD